MNAADVGLSPSPAERSAVRRTLRPLTALATALAGLLTVASSLSPNLRGRTAVLERLEPHSAQAAAHALGVVGGLAVMALAPSVLQGRRRTGRVAVAVLTVLVVVHAAKGLDYEEAAVVLGVALLLEAALRAQRRERAPSRALLAGLVAISVVAASYAATLIVLVLSGHDAGIAGALSAATSALVDGGAAAGRVPSAVLHVLAGAVVVAAIAVARIVLAATRPPDGHTAGEHARAAAIVSAHGDDSIAPFVLRADKSYFFACHGVLAYRVLRETAVVAGDPVGPPGAAVEIVRRFLALAAAQGWGVVLLCVRGDHVAGYEALGLRSMQVGLEAVVDPRTFTLEGGRAKVVRKAVGRVARHGWTVDVRRAADLEAAEIDEITAVEHTWRRRAGGRLVGFAMASDRLWGAEEDCDDVYALARAPDGELRAFQRYVPYGRGLSLDAMRRLDDHPNGIADALVAATLAHARVTGCEEVSLNFASFAHLMAAETVERRLHRVARWVLRRFHHRFQLERLMRFTQKFGPTWRARHLVFTSRTSLPRAALRVMQAEAYVRPPDAHPRRDAWRPAPVPVTVPTTPAQPAPRSTR